MLPCFRRCITYEHRLPNPLPTTMVFPERIESDRLTLERLTREHIDLFELYRISSQDPGIDDVTQYMPWSPHDSIKETIDFVEQVEQAWAEDEAATYVIRPREGEDGAGEIAGITELSCDWDRRTGELGIWLRQRFWGRGYSGERAEQLIALAFERLDLELVAVTHHVENEQSQRAIEKYVEAHGGQRDGLLRNWIPYDGEVADEYRYTITRPQYLAAEE